MNSNTISRLRAAVRDIPDFPKPGIVFKDITPILSDRALFKESIDLFVDACADLRVDKIVGIDARGFLFGAAAAYKLGAGFIPMRKKGKLPYQTAGMAYALEYGEAEMELHVDAILPGERIVLIDDLLATGGTAAAAIKLIKAMGGELLSTLFLIELEFLEGRKALQSQNICSFITF